MTIHESVLLDCMDGSCDPFVQLLGYPVLPCGYSHTFAAKART